MSGYEADPAAAQTVAAEMTKTAQTLRSLNEQLTQAAHTSLADWNASAKDTWTQLQGKLTEATNGLSAKGLMAGASVNDTMDAIVGADRKIANLF